MIALSVLLDMIDDEDAKKRFEYLYDKFFKNAYYKSLEILKKEYLAEEALQDAFEYLAENYSKIVYREEPAAKSYILKTVTTKSIDKWNDEFKVSKVQFESVEESEETFKEQIDRYEIAELKIALSKLREFDRDLLILFYIDGYKSKELAELFDISDDNVRKRLQRARGALRKEMEGKVKVNE